MLLNQLSQKEIIIFSENKNSKISFKTKAREIIIKSFLIIVINMKIIMQL